MKLKVSNFKFGIGIPTNFPFVASSFFDSFIQMDRPTFVYIPAKNGPIESLRNQMVENALQAGCTHLIMMDADQVYPKDTIPRLLAHNLPIVHAVVHRRYPPFDSILYEGALNGFTNKTDYKDGDLIEVDACGTGCVLYQTKIFQEMDPPWFEFVQNPDKEKGGVVGEDIWFCHKARKMGYKIMVDTSVKVGHLTLFSVDDAFSTLYQALLKRKIRHKEE